MIGVKPGNFAMPREYRIVVSGTVQGVFFRAKTKEHADRLGIKGTVRNLKSGQVEICVVGTEEEAKLLLAAMEKEPPPIEISLIEMTDSPAKHSCSDFRVIH